MKSPCLELSLALSDNHYTRPLLQGRVNPQGVHFIPSAVHPSEMFWRQLKYADFDVSEMSLSSLLISISRGDHRWVALPIYTSRTFFQTWILKRTDRGIESPVDLKGKRVGVPEYQQTAALWSRGILRDEFGVDSKDIEWYMERGPQMSHGGSTGFVPPPGVVLHQIPSHTNIGEMLVKGELDATLLYLSHKNLVDRSSLDVLSFPFIKPLFENPFQETKRYFDKTGLFPINHTLVMKRDLYEKHPWLAINIFHAFQQAKEQADRDAVEAIQSMLETGHLLSARDDASWMNQAKSYGMKNSRAVIEKIASYIHQQGLTDRVVSVDEVFAKSTLDI
jgi:4,5-dihydroxyphthalate decarboxylase